MKQVFGVIMIFTLILLFAVACQYNGDGKRLDGIKDADDNINAYVESYLDKGNGYVIILEKTHQVEHVEYFIYKVVVFNDTDTREYNYLVTVDENKNINRWEIRE